jgi:hypothetical protein
MTTTVHERKRQQNLEDAEQRRVEFPTEEEWVLAEAAVDGALISVMNVMWKLERIGEFKGARTATLEDIGLVYCRSIDLKSRLEELNSWGFKDVLANIDYVRALNNVPDDDPDDKPAAS